MAMISLCQWELEAPAVCLPKVRSRIICALFANGHRERGVLVGICNRRSRRWKATEVCDTTERETKNRQYVYTYVPTVLYVRHADTKDKREGVIGT